MYSAWLVFSCCKYILVDNQFCDNYNISHVPDLFLSMMTRWVNYVFYYEINFDNMQGTY